VQASLQNLETHVLDEAEKFTRLLEESGAVHEEPQVEAYLNSLFEQFVPPLTDSPQYRFRLRILRDPTLNAFTLANGSIYANSGLMARLKTRQQFAFVMGHEISHVMKRDILYFRDQYYDKTITAKVADLLLTPALTAFGFGGVGELGVSLTYAASITGYGREREAEADQEALLTLQRLGYDEREAMRVFELFLAEHDRYAKGIEIGFLSSHPSNRQRLEVVKQALGAQALDMFKPETVDHEFLDRTQRLRVDNAAFNVQLGRYYHAVEDLQIILQRTPHDAAALFQLAEAYRLIAKDPKRLKEELSRKAWAEIRQIGDKAQQTYWWSRAEETYRKALDVDPRFVDSHRGLGLLCLDQEKPELAQDYFQAYLTLAPEAKDRRFVSSLLVKAQQQADQGKVDGTP